MKTFLTVVSTVFLLASPWVLYWTLTHKDVTVGAIILIAWVVVRAVPIVLAAKKEQRNAALQLPAIALVFALAGLVSNNGLYLLVLPSATQAAFGLTFLRSLKTTPLIEHFARMVKTELTAPELAHCRSWTRVWGYYLFVLAAIGLVIAKLCTLGVWTLYVGVLSYVLVGLLFAVEYVVRKVEFRDYNRKNPIDLVISLFAPAPPAKDLAS